MVWQELFDRAAAVDVDEEDVREALARVRDREADNEGNADSDASENSTSSPPESAPARVVADADVLAADLLVGGPARAALEALWRHSWTTLIASDALLDDAEAVVAELAESELADPADASLAADWRAAVADWREPVDHPANDHPALGSAYRGGAMHVLSLDDRLTSAGAGAALRDRVPISVREPQAFAAVFDAERLYPEIRDGDYPGPDREPREKSGDSAR